MSPSALLRELGAWRLIHLPLSHSRFVLHLFPMKLCKVFGMLVAYYSLCYSDLIFMWTGIFKCISCTLSTGLAALADHFPQRILERLLQDFQRGPTLPSSDKERSLETRLKVGEVLMRTTRAMGEMLWLWVIIMCISLISQELTQNFTKHISFCFKNTLSVLTFK